MSKEIWQDILGYEGLYKISNLGNVRSLERGVRCKGFRILKGKMLRPSASKGGYLKVALSSEGIVKTKKVHRAVAETFLPNPGNLPQVNHIDEVKTNNTLDNLEWCTSQYNMEHSHAKCYEFISPGGEQIGVFNLSKFCRENNLEKSSMFKILSGKAKQHKGWRRIK